MWLKEHVREVSTPAFKKQGSVLYRVIADWTLIAGEQLKTRAFPLSVKFGKDKSGGGTLFLEAINPSCGLELEMMIPTILSKIDIYFGYKVITKIKVVLCDKADFPLDDAIKPTYKKRTLKQNDDLAKIINQNRDIEIRASLMNIAEHIES